MDSDGARFAEIPEMTSFLHYFRLGLPCMYVCVRSLRIWSSIWRRPVSIEVARRSRHSKLESRKTTRARPRSPLRNPGYGLLNAL
jgi:hypothetical protein